MCFYLFFWVYKTYHGYENKGDYMKRTSGILMHITSIPSPYGIGTLGREAYDFVDFLDEAGQAYWQVLPLNPTSYGDSPYQSPSAFAGNPNLIDFDLLKKDGLLEESDYADLDFGQAECRVDYGKIFFHKLDVLKLAFKNTEEGFNKQIEQFKKDNEYWLEDYTLYMALKHDNGLKAWHEWDEDIKLRTPSALDFHKNKLKTEIKFWTFLQFVFYKQWGELRTYANNKNIKIIGDIPIYVAEDSVDVWTKSENFLLDEKKMPIAVAGVPRDDFSDNGQYWGNPLYDWEYLKEHKYDWWVERFKANLKLYDVLRLDHFRGFESYWSIEYGSKTATEGEWKRGPKEELFDTLKDRLGEIPMIVEDLGQVTEGLVEFRESVGYPAMKILQLAYSSDETNEHLPHHYERNWVVYTGTHDNPTMTGWLNSVDKDSLDYAKKYLQLNEQEGYDWGMIRGAWSSVANLSIAQMQDFLGIGDEGRMNSPNTIEGNWQWRIQKIQLTDDLAARIKDLTVTYDRIKEYN